MGKNQTHSAGAARSTKLPWGASDLKGHRRGVRKGHYPPPTVGPHEDPHLRASTPAEESRRQVTPTNREGPDSGTQNSRAANTHKTRQHKHAQPYAVRIGHRNGTR